MNDAIADTGKAADTAKIDDHAAMELPQIEKDLCTPKEIIKDRWEIVR